MKTILKGIGLVFLTMTLAFTSANKKIIVIDVSHGGQDNGISLGELNEKDITLNIAKQIQAQNKNAAIEIVLTRDSDAFLTPKERTEYINALKPDFVMSLHVNSNEDENKSGIEIAVSNKNKQTKQSKKWAQTLFKSFNTPNVAIKTTDLYLLNTVNAPIALVELGYLTNKKDRQLLTSEKGQRDIATAILNALE